MAIPFPKTLPKKGKGRVDNTHQIALLTDFEVAALNHLKNKDKERGFPSGSGPEIRELAAKNSRPIEFVNYRGERIPSLNDFSEESGGEKNETAGESEAREQTSSGGDYGGSNDWASRERKRKEKEKADKLAAEKLYQKKQKEKKEKEEKTQKDLQAIQDYLDWHDNANKQGSTDYEDFGPNEDGSLRPERDPGWEPPAPGDPGYEEYMEENVASTYPTDNGDGTTATTTPPGDGPGLSEKEFNDLTEQYDLKPEFEDEKGEMHWTQDDANTANKGYLATGKTDLIGGAEGFDQDLSGDYKTVYEQQLSDAYDAAYAGVGQDILNAGGGTGTEYDDLEALKGGQEDYLTELADNYQAEAQTRYDNWLNENTTNINKLTSLDDIKNYEWSAMPEYDTDLSGGYGEDGVFQEDFMPEFYKDSNKVYGKNYKKPSGWEYDADGNPVPGSAGPDTEEADTEEPLAEGSVVAKAPIIRYAPGSPGATSKTRSSAKYY